MDLTDPATLRSLGTVLLSLAFVGLCVWVFSARQRRRFEEAARLPLDDDAGPAPAPGREQDDVEQQRESGGVKR